MTEVVIQHIVLPSNEDEGARPLYVKGYDGSFPIRIGIGESVDLRAFFNFFPSERYRRYSGIDHILLRLDCEGSPKICVSRYGKNNSETESYDYKTDLRIDLRDEILLGIVIKAEGSEVIVNSGCISAEVASMNDVCLAHVICTYRREDLMKSKMDRICSFFDDCGSIKDSLTMYVIDNGGTFDYRNDMVKVVKSGNYGGSGGFTRGMIEAVNDGVSTHVTLNDDDAMLDPETIYRTCSFYRLLSEDKKDTILGGTIFEKERPCTVHEAGAFYRDGKLVMIDGMDATTADGCVEIDQGLNGKEDDSYFAWCYMTVPSEVIRNNGLALPLFFQCDDVDFGIRIKDVPKITMCGISVWHPFVRSHSVNKIYYGTRNMLAIIASNRLIGLGTLKSQYYYAMMNVGCYRYRTAEAQLQAMRDLRKGPDHVFTMITEKPFRFKEYEFTEPSLSREKVTSRIINHGKTFNIITLNGVLFPSIGDIEADLTEWDTRLFYRKGKAYYISSDGKEVVCKRSRMKTISLTLKITANIGLIWLKKRKLNRIYSDKSKYYHSEEYWQKIFNDRMG